MASFYNKICRTTYQYENPYVSKLCGVFESLDDEELLNALKAKVHRGCQGYNVKALWRSYLARYALNLPSVAELIRCLKSNPLLCEASGINPNAVPHEATYSRFVSKLSKHAELVKKTLDKAVNVLQENLFDFGKIVAIDSSDIHAHSQGVKNDSHERAADPDATWGAKKKKGSRYFWFGYKVHMVSDATLELPICVTVTTAKESDYRNFIPPLKRASIKPEIVTADAGYDAKANYGFAVYELGAIPIIDLNKRGSKKGGKTSHRTKAERRLLDIRDNPGISRDSHLWKHLYNKRTSIERIFSRLKEHRALDDITHRGIEKVTLHCYLATLTIVASAVSAIYSQEPLRRVA